MTDEKRRLKVFLCHAHSDQAAVRALYKRLSKDGVDAWLDKEKLLGGANWEYEIRKAVRESDVVVICISCQFSEGGFRQKEVQIALDEAALKPKEEIFIIPVRLEECAVIEQLANWHWVDLFRRGGYYKLMESLKSRGLQLQRETVELPKPDETNPNLAGELKPEQTKNIFVTVDGNVQGNIIIGNENAVQSQTVQPGPEKQVEPKPPVVVEKKEPEKPVLPPPGKKKEPKKAWYRRTEIIIALIGLIGTLCAALISTLPWKDLFAARPVPTEATIVALPATATPAFTFTPFATDEPTLTPTAEFAPTRRVEPVETATPWPTEITEKGAKMALIPSGTFTMGDTADAALAECKKYRNDCQRDWFTDEESPHQVTLDDFYMDVYEVTNALYKACEDAGGCTKLHDTKSYSHPSYYGNSQYDNYPVIYVDWNQAKTYCAWRGARLPTEAEWEYSARGTDGRTYPWGEGIDKTFANYKNTVGDTTAVGSYEKGKSFFGMYDMAGNVWEWVGDWYDAYPGNTLSNSEYGTKFRVLRGGSWNNYSYDVRSALRYRNNQTIAYYYLGFRCSRSP